MSEAEQPIWLAIACPGAGHMFRFPSHQIREQEVLTRVGTSFVPSTATQCAVHVPDNENSTV